MLVSEIKEILKDYQEEDLRLLIVELYKAMAKRVREDKDIDDLLKNAKERLHNKNAVKKQEKITDIKLLKPEIGRKSALTVPLLPAAWRADFL